MLEKREFVNGSRNSLSASSLDCQQWRRRLKMKLIKEGEKRQVGANHGVGGTVVVAIHDTKKRCVLNRVEVMLLAERKTRQPAKADQAID